MVAAQKYMEELSTRGKASRFATARRNAFDPIVYSTAVPLTWISLPSPMRTWNPGKGMPTEPWW